MEQLKQEDYRNILVFLNRVNLQGNESIIHAGLMQKVSSLIEPKQISKVETEKKE